MTSGSCCGSGNDTCKPAEYEIVRLEKPQNSCALCEDYAKRQTSKPVAVMSCEGACLRGEISRQAANLICNTLAPDDTVRICLGGAFTKNTGQRGLVRDAKKVIALEGCYVNCSSRMMKGVIEELTPEVVIADRLYDFDRKLFSIEEMPEEEIKAHAETVARKVAAML